MRDPEILRDCEVRDCFKIAVGTDFGGRRLCDSHYKTYVVPNVRRFRGRSWRDVDPVPLAELLIGVLCASRPASNYPPGHYWAQCDVCRGEWVIGPDEYPYPVCHICDERYERRQRGEV
jgi:hypothetical protein